MPRIRLTYFPLAALLSVEFALLVAVGLADKLCYDGLCLFREGVALYFPISSVGYGVKVNANQTKRNP